MPFLVRLARVLLTLVLAFIVISAVVGLVTPETGILEKVVLLATIAGCLVLAASIGAWSTRAQGRLHRPRTSG